MKKRPKHTLSLFASLCLALLLAGCGGSSTTTTTGVQSPTASQASPTQKPVVTGPTFFENFAKRFPHIHVLPFQGAPDFNDSPQFPLVYHQGNVMRTASTTYAIFWEPSRLPDGTASHVSATYNGLVERYFKDVGGSPLYNIASQYFDNGGQIANSSTFGGAWLDTSPYPASNCRDSYTPHGCMLDTQVQQEVAKAITANNWTAGPTHLFFVFTAWGEGSCTDSASTDCAFNTYCAYHSFYNAGQQSVLYANMPYLGSVPRRCEVRISPNNDVDADSVISTASHEHMETVTDPFINAWFDPMQEEIGDKCAWTFGSISLDGGKANVEWNNHFYIVQQEWSNIPPGCALGV